MLTEKSIAKVLRMSAQLGGNDGSCFGTLDPSRLRRTPGSCYMLPPVPARYTLMQRGLFISRKLDATNRRAAFAEVRIVLGLKRLSKKRFREAGGIAIQFGRKTIYPTRKRRST